MTRGFSWRLGLWLAFAALWSLVFGAVVLLGQSLARLERSERQARQAAAVEENLRLGLWRIDSLLAPLIAQQMLLQIPASDTTDLAGETEPNAEGMKSAVAGLDRLPIQGSFRWLVSPNEPDDHWHAFEQLQVYQRNHVNMMYAQPMADSNVVELNEGYSSQINRSIAANEFNQRAQNFERNNALVVKNGALLRFNQSNQPLLGFWHRGKLLLIRNVSEGALELEGWELDWPTLRSAMQLAVRDLLPEVDFQPVDDVHAPRSPDMLVSIPCLMIPGAVAGNVQEIAVDREWPVAWVLGLLWICSLATFIVTGWAMAIALRLSDRRAAFVAAVTHELRTPLTTLRLYSEMLSNGMIEDESSRRFYLSTLKNEVDRIGHLVENVFAYAKLERGRGPSSMERMDVQELFERVRPRLEMLCQRTDMQLRLAPDGACVSEVQADRSMIEQILINLVDNAAKHARGSFDPCILMRSLDAGRDVHLVVQDHGPGIAKGRRWWRPFSKTVEQAAESSAPGIGLGLSISHRLARQMGGRLIVESSSSGTTVTLVLPKGSDQGRE